MQWFVAVLTACAPVMVALVGIIPTVISNRKKTQKSIEESNENMKRSVDKLQGTIDAHIREDEDDRARTKRYRILRFFDEMCEGRRHSESHYEDILDDIDDYEQYCATHPGFRNSRGQAAMAAIKGQYAKIKAGGGFLVHEDGDVARKDK